MQTGTYKSFEALDDDLKEKPDLKAPRIIHCAAFMGTIQGHSEKIHDIGECDRKIIYIKSIFPKR